MRRLPVLVYFALLLAVACGNDRQHYVPNVGDGMTTPTMATTDVETLISDSGYTRYKVVAPLWQMFEDANDPFWRFPEGLYLEQYDLNMNPESMVECDSATYFSRKRLWRLDGNVMMINTQQDSFLTQQVFWDQTTRKMYSDSFIHIVRTDRIIEGYGFESDQSMTSYTVHRPTAILPAERSQKVQKTDTTTTDSVATVAPVPAQQQQRQRPGIRNSATRKKEPEMGANGVPTSHPGEPNTRTRKRHNTQTNQPSR